MSLMPTRLLQGHARSTSIDTVFCERRMRLEREAEYYPPGRQVCGYTLPSWQRDIKWSEDQCVRFVESAWLGLHLGTWVSNAMDWSKDGAHPLSGVLVDGQQRFFALDQYWNDAFPVFGHRWSDLPVIERRRFLSTPFASTELEVWDERILREIYDRLNFGGTPHLETERAITASQAEQTLSDSKIGARPRPRV